MANPGISEGAGARPSQGGCISVSLSTASTGKQKKIGNFSTEKVHFGAILHTIFSGPAYLSFIIKAGAFLFEWKISERF